MIDLKDKALIQQGRMNLDLAERNMGALMVLRERFARAQTFKNLRIGMALHVTKETGVLVRALRDGGAKVAITSCNPLSAQDDVVAALNAEGVEVYGYKGESRSDYYNFLKKVIDFKPNVTIDDGCDLVSEIHSKRPELIKNIIGGCEETTTGVIRLRAMEKDGALKYPIIAVNDNDTKHLMDNYYGTGQSTLDGIIRASNVLIAGKYVVVAGYGDCGKGVARRAAGMGAKVIVTEVRPFRALQARMDGFEVMPMSEAARIGEIFITVTGDCDVIRPEHVRVMKDGVILANSGHFDVEIDLKGIAKMARSVRRVRPFLDEYLVEQSGTISGANTFAVARAPTGDVKISSPGRDYRNSSSVGSNQVKNEAGDKRIYVAGEGRLVNLAAAEGHPSEVMSLSFCGQALAVEYLLKNKGKLKPGVHLLPPQIDEEISALQLKVLGVKIDKLTDRQKKYLASWQEGT